MMLSALAGLVAHIFNPLIMKFHNTPHQLQLMIRYVIGGVTILGANYKVVELESDKENAKKQTYRLSAIMVGVGSGVLVGHFLEEVYYRYWRTE